MRNTFLTTCVATALLSLLMANSVFGQTKPFQDGRFVGRIAYSADGNHNDPDDWAASPVALAIFAESGVKDRLVHFDYNCILPLTDPEYERKHAESVLGAAERYGFNRSRFFDCRKNLDQAIASLTAAINESSATNPLYFVIAGPMEVPARGLEKSDPAKRRFVYCLSHSRWNDGFASGYKFTFTKRTVIEQDVHWVQIRDQNPLLSLSPYKRPARPEEFAAFFWMRDSCDPKVRFLWERTLVSTRPDPSDAGMAYFLVTGDEDCDPAKLRRLIEDHRPASPVVARSQIRLEAENFRHLEGFALEDRKDKTASHQLNVQRRGGTGGRIRTTFDEPFARAVGRCDVVIRHRDDEGSRGRYALFVNGAARGAAWESAGNARGWTSQVLRDVEIRLGDEIRVDAESATARLDYVQLNFAD
ncbi:MAG: hypothetical protein HZA90_17825 [Verrucomicrobia bacterium]|nr:hypothetical protein [Verrucomicrobiota bacterium]